MIKCYYGRIFERETENLHRSEKKRSKFEVNLIISFYLFYLFLFLTLTMIKLLLLRLRIFVTETYKIHIFFYNVYFIYSLQSNDYATRNE